MLGSHLAVPDGSRAGKGKSTKSDDLERSISQKPTHSDVTSEISDQPKKTQGIVIRERSGEELLVLEEAQKAFEEQKSSLQQNLNLFKNLLDDSNILQKALDASEMDKGTFQVILQQYEQDAARLLQGSSNPQELRNATEMFRGREEWVSWIHDVVVGKGKKKVDLAVSDESQAGKDKLTGPDSILKQIESADSEVSISQIGSSEGVERWHDEIKTNIDNARLILTSLGEKLGAEGEELDAETRRRWNQHLTSIAEQAKNDRAKASIRLEDLHKESKAMLCVLQSKEIKLIDGYADDPVFVTSIKPEHIDEAINVVSSKHNVIESKEEQQSIVKALEVLNDLKGVITSPKYDLESRQMHWDYISVENVLDNSHLKGATDVIKNAARSKEQNADLTARETPGPIEGETSPTRGSAT
ncbi:MAG TPA: hypothetical protein VGL94_12690 [Ktedonobacteraceae bacterium]|jgi:hypothetical protein